MAPFSTNTSKVFYKFYIAVESSLLEKKEIDVYQLPNENLGLNVLLLRNTGIQKCVFNSEYVHI